MHITKNGRRLEDVIKKAIEDLKITPAEYQEISGMVAESNDLHSMLLFKELQGMIDDNTVVRVPE